MKHKFIRIIAFALTASLFAACGDGGSDQKQKLENFEEEKQSDKSFNPDDVERTRTVVFPSAHEIMTVFKNAGLKYKPDVTNDVANKSNYNTRFQKALAVGFYTSGLAYHVIHNQSAEAPEYLKVILELSSEIGISGVSADDELVQNFENSMGDEEKMLEIMSDIQSETDAYIADNDMQDWQMLIFSGAWLEGMYIGVKANDSYNTGDLSRRISEQMSILENQISVLESTDLQGEDFDSYMNSLKELEELYNSYPEVQNAEGVPKLGVNQLKEISDQIKTLRNSLI